jgi:hypothetical protein
MYNSRHKEAPAGTEATKSEYNGILLSNKNDHRERTAQRKTKILADFDSSLVTQGQRWHDARKWAVRLYTQVGLEVDDIEQRLADHYGHDMHKEMRGLTRNLSKFQRYEYGGISPKWSAPIRPKAKPKTIDLEKKFSSSVSVPESAFLEKSEFTLSCGRDDARLLISHCFEAGELVAIKDRHASPSIIKSREEWLEYLVKNPVPQTIAGSWFYANPIRKEVLDRDPIDRHISGKDIAGFRYALLENDSLGLSTQLELAGRVLPYLQAVVFSGVKSYHCLVRVDAEDIDDYRRVVSRIKLLVGSGCSRFAEAGYDVCTLCPSAHARMCGAARELVEQRLVFLTSTPSVNPVFGDKLS